MSMLKKYKIIILLFSIMYIIIPVQQVFGNNEENIDIDDLINIDSKLRYKDINLDLVAKQKLQNFYLDEIYDFGILFDYGLYNQNFNESDKKALIDYNGNITIDPIVFKNGIALVNVNNKSEDLVTGDDLCGYINENYEWIIPPIYKNGKSYVNGYALADRGDNTFVFNTHGEIEFSFSKSKYYYEYVFGGDAILKLIDIQNKNVYLLDKKFNIVNEYVLNDAERAELSQNGYISFDNSVRNNIYYRYDKVDDDIIVTGYNINGEKISSININNIINDNFEIYTTQILSNGEFILTLKIRGNDFCTVLFSALTGESYSSFIWEDTLPYNQVYTMSDFVIFDNGIVMDKKLNYIGKLFNKNDLYIYADSERCVCAIFDRVEKINENILIDRYFILKNLFVLYTDDIGIGQEGKIINKNRIRKYVEPKDVYGEINIYLNNKRLNFDIAPITEGDRTLVPMRVIFEALGAEVEWENETQTAIAIKDGITVSVTINSNKMLKNGEEIELDVPARLVGDSRTVVPLRAISEAFGCQVEWDEGLQRVDIYTN